MPRLNDRQKLYDGYEDDLWLPLEMFGEVPLDLCHGCWDVYDFTDEDETDHPSYSDDEYNCIVCGVRLDPLEG